MGVDTGISQPTKTPDSRQTPGDALTWTRRRGTGVLVEVMRRHRWCSHQAVHDGHKQLDGKGGETGS